ncbi:hypothetical protein [Vulcanisaeta souniana]|uniref:hypothetical protein n=1 Tax=Vulcanisaeta souniana TaxID=164452 RepID=UPI000A9B5F34|nr:hypothetical protein [Vulcanisaeta souniana]
MLSRELNITTEFNISSSESIKRELNRELGKRVSSILGVQFSREEPDVETIIDIATGSVTTQVMPIYILTRYRKVHRVVGDRENTRWPIDRVVQAYGAQEAIVHAGGDDPSAARVLGNGRPVVIQVIRPGKRLDIKDISPLLMDPNYDVQLEEPSYVKSSIIMKMKARVRDYVITYRVLAIADDNVTNEAMITLHDYFRNRQVAQRIRHGRRIRRRISMVYELNGSVVRGGRLVEFLIKCQGNLYIRGGFVHGGFGDVEPSIAGVLGIGVKPVEIDILNITD